MTRPSRSLGLVGLVGLVGLASVSGCDRRQPAPPPDGAPSVLPAATGFVSDCGDYRGAVDPVLERWKPKLAGARAASPADLRALATDADAARADLERLHPRDAAAGTHLLRVRGTLRDVAPTLRETADAHDGVGGPHNALQLAQQLDDRVRELADEQDSLRTLCR